MSTTTGRAPGRLDLLGGVADYSGALVLRVPTTATTTVTAEPASAFEVGGVVLEPDAITELARRPDAAVRAALRDAPSWTRYPVGVAVVLVRHGAIAPPRVRLTVESDVPIAQGVSSSAALEVATARALGAGRLDPVELALLCQAAENGIVGAPCGIMDQAAVAAGRAGAILPILCRPITLADPVELPQGVEVVGWPSGATHEVGGAAYGRARAAAFMGKRIAEARSGTTWQWTSELPAALVDDLPEVVDGATFRDRWGRTDDPLSSVEDCVEYPVRAAASFGVHEHRRTTAALDHLRRGDLGTLGTLLAASHAGYRTIGLGHEATDAVVAEARAQPGVHGARSSGGGDGGTVVVLCDEGALDDVDGLIR